MGVVVFTAVRRPFGSFDFQTILVLGPLQKILLPLIFQSNVPFFIAYLVVLHKSTYYLVIILKALPAMKWKKGELLMLSNLTSPNLIWSEYLVSDWYQLVWQWSLECPILALVWLFHQCRCLLNQTSKWVFLLMWFQCHQLMQTCSKKIKIHSKIVIWERA